MEIVMIGFEPEAIERFTGHTGGAVRSIASLVEFQIEPRPDEIVLFAPNIAREVIILAQGDSKINIAIRQIIAAVWVPSDAQPLEIPEWQPLFRIQLCEADEVDLKWIERLSRCPRVLNASEWVAGVPADWFAKLTITPKVMPVSEFPFNNVVLQHINTCRDCEEVVRDGLHLTHIMRRQLICPSSQALYSWVVASGSDQLIEEHLQKCSLCSDAVQFQIAIAESLQIVSAKAAMEKLSALTPASSVDRTKANRTLLAVGVQPMAELIKDLVGFVRELSLGLAGSMMVYEPARGRQRAERAIKPTREHLDALLDSHGAISLRRADLWISISLEQGGVVLRAGTSPAQRFDDFELVFLAGDRELASLTSDRGAVRIDETLLGAFSSEIDRIELRIIEGTMHG